ncbi:MAG: hypothetical protein PHX87_02520 [Candidatus Peribacteraceae bacterium]|nr:hypothetical protein [Candidatus Peribacteraceae bacterium]MDD5742282.1 hypothetical protein [Candidatus Peribacteraceae bacterium]
MIGVTLAVSVSGSTGTTVSIAQETSSASAQALSQAMPTVSLLPLSPEHEARSGTRILSKQRTWVPVPVSAPAVENTMPPAKPKRSFLSVVDQPDIQERHKIIADEVLRLLPDRCTSRIRNFYVRYDKPDRRGLAGKDTIILDGTLPDDEFRAVLIHEALGHVFDLGCLTGSPLAGNSIFKDGNEPIFRDDASLSFYRISWADSTHQRGGTTAEDFVSGYAASDPFEDLAESAIYYILHNDTFRQRARTDAALATKLKWLQTFLPVAPVAQGTLGTAWDGTVPWDATKLAYEWKRQVVANQ